MFVEVFKVDGVELSLLFNPHMSMGPRWNDTDRGKPKNLSQSHHVHQKTRMD
jgi:hypothetical protein